MHNLLLSVQIFRHKPIVEDGMFVGQVKSAATLTISRGSVVGVNHHKTPEPDCPDLLKSHIFDKPRVIIPVFSSNEPDTPIAYIGIVGFCRTLTPRPSAEP